jgi:hypothetical protein
MGERPVLTARLSERTLDRLEKYADREGMSKSKAADLMIKQGLDVEESDMRLIPVRSDGGTVIEDGFEQIDSQLQEIDRDLGDRLEQLDEEVQTVTDRNKRLEEIQTGLFVGFAGIVVWAASVLTYDISLSLSVGSASLLLLWLLYFFSSLHLGGYTE